MTSARILLAATTAFVAFGFGASAFADPTCPGCHDKVQSLKIQKDNIKIDDPIDLTQPNTPPPSPPPPPSPCAGKVPGFGGFCPLKPTGSVGVASGALKSATAVRVR